MKVAERIAVTTGGSTVTIGATAILGWIFDIEFLKSPLPGPMVMIPVTAVAMIASGGSVLVMRRPDYNVMAVRLLGIFVILIGAASFFERLTDIGLGFDLLLFPDDVLRYPFEPPGRMAINSAVSFAFAGAAVVASTSQSLQWRRAAHGFATSGLAIAALALIGYLFGARPLYALDQATGMALMTAIGLALVHVGILFELPDPGFISLVTQRDLAGGLMRRILPAAIIAPVLLGWIWIRVREMELMSREGAVAFYVLLIVGIIVTLVMRSAILLRESDQAREALLAREGQLRRAAEQANTAKSTFLATMSHELRTPLNAIIGYTTLMIDGVPQPVSPVQAEQLKRVESSARHLLGLIEDVLTVAHMEVGQQRMVMSRVRLGDLLGDSLAIAQPMAAVRRLTIETDFRDADVLVETDPVRFRQILLNLIVNAVKFTDEGSVFLACRVEAGRLVVIVRDTGIGIAPEHLTHIFEPFWQVEQSNTRATGGSGLGLAVSRQLIGLLGGELTVESVVGRGTTFQVTLPMRFDG